MQKRLLIVGAGGHARVVLDMAVAQGWDVQGFIDNEKPAHTMLNGHAVCGSDTFLFDHLGTAAVIVAIGHQATRRKISLAVKAAGGKLATVIHPSCIISPTARIGAGSVVIAGSIVNVNSVIGEFCILNTACSIDHDCKLADGVQVCPGAHLAGNVQCGEDVFIGTGAAIIPKIRIGDRAVIGAGTVVIRDVPADTRAVGAPAKYS